MTVDFLREGVGADMAAIDRVLRSSLASDVGLIGQVAEHIIGGGGKRLRPALLVLCAKATGYHGDEHHTLAAAIEMIHTATLLHDDVVDESSLRRGAATANAQFGNAASVLVGDFLYSRAFQMVVGIGRMRVLEILAETTNAIAEGEVLQLMNAGDADLTEASYFDVIQRKTARLFEASARIGAVLGGGTRADEDPLGRYGMHLGTAFQLVDDILDYSGDAQSIGKNVGDDLAEGKMTLPLIHALAEGTPDEAAVIRDAVSGGGREDFAAVVAALDRTGALAYARRRADEEVRLAALCLQSLPDSPERQTLLELTVFASARTY